MPRVEDEGIGAVVASYKAPETEEGVFLATGGEKEGKPKDEVEVEELEKDTAGAEVCPDLEDNNSSNSSESLSTECRDEREDGGAKTTKTHTNYSTPSFSLVGSIVVGTSTSKEDWRDIDFATILSVLRCQPGPIVLELLLKPVWEETTLEEDDNHLRLEKSVSSSSSSSSSKKGDDDVADLESISSSE